MTLQQFELIRDKIKSSTTPAELTDAISFGMNNSQWLSDGQQDTLRLLVDEKRKALGDPNVERVKQAYDKVDAEQFKPITIEESTPNPEANTPKRTRKTKEEATTPVVMQNMYRVKRRVNRPIDGVQYSNNEYEVEVSSTDQATLLSELDAIEKEVIQRLALYRKDDLEAYGQKKYAEWVASVKPVVTTAPQKVNTFEYDMSGAVSLDLQYTLARYQRLNSFVLQSFEKFPEVKAFYAEFDKLNPKINPPSL